MIIITPIIINIITPTIAPTMVPPLLAASAAGWTDSNEYYFTYTVDLV